MGVIIRSTVKKAAKLAVYEEIMISVKNHQMPPTIRVEVACLIRSKMNVNKRDLLERKGYIKNNKH